MNTFFLFLKKKKRLIMSSVIFLFHNPILNPPNLIFTNIQFQQRRKKHKNGKTQPTTIT